MTVAIIAHTVLINLHELSERNSSRLPSFLSCDVDFPRLEIHFEILSTSSGCYIFSTYRILTAMAFHLPDVVGCLADMVG